LDASTGAAVPMASPGGGKLAQQAALRNRLLWLMRNAGGNLGWLHLSGLLPARQISPFLIRLFDFSPKKGEIENPPSPRGKAWVLPHQYKKSTRRGILRVGNGISRKRPGNISAGWYPECRWVPALPEYVHSRRRYSDTRRCVCHSQGSDRCPDPSSGWDHWGWPSPG